LIKTDPAQIKSTASIRPAFLKAKETVDQGVKAYFTEMVRDWTCLAELAERQGW
jgi:hypothetical protein